VWVLTCAGNFITGNLYIVSLLLKGSLFCNLHQCSLKGKVVIGDFWVVLAEDTFVIVVSFLHEFWVLRLLRDICIGTDSYLRWTCQFFM
jgi:hypothetical protein